MARWIVCVLLFCITGVAFACDCLMCPSTTSVSAFGTDNLFWTGPQCSSGQTLRITRFRVSSSSALSLNSQLYSTGITMPLSDFSTTTSTRCFDPVTANTAPWTFTGVAETNGVPARMRVLATCSNNLFACDVSYEIVAACVAPMAWSWTTGQFTMCYANCTQSRWCLSNCGPDSCTSLLQLDLHALGHLQRSVSPLQNCTMPRQ
eukprot:TRINITY_DN6347_c0_g1_i1.p1 TRINITY_DN6347_c0_g1~~TRINITY_DN6347_c0_g1_i1.p1  ORF type:complete len:205 (-),score=18.29 TRINITY_DN6347_c0_g1_i1:285-899(-)